MRVIGIDCGIAITGWAIIERSAKKSSLDSIEVIDFGVIRTESRQKNEDRLLKLYKELGEIIQKYKPACAAIEDLFYFKNQKTIISVGQARGVIILCAVNKKLKICEYTPLQVKQAVTGYGRATKDQIQRMIKAILKLEEIPKPDDAADALAIAVCHLNTSR